MTRNISHRISAMFMALLMLLSSTGFSMDIHYCQNQFAGFSFIGKASCCKKAVNTKPCHSVKTKKLNGINQAEKDNCCHNESIVIEKADLDATNVQYGTINDIQFDFVVVPVSVAEFLINYNAQLDVVPFDQYKPPLPDRDIQVLYQTFLI